MIFGSAEDDGFLHSVGAFQIFRNLPGNLINAVLENDGVIVIPVVVNAVFNDIAARAVVLAVVIAVIMWRPSGLFNFKGR